MLAVFIATVNL